MFARLVCVLSAAFATSLVVPVVEEVTNVTSEISTASISLSGTCSFHATVRQYCVKNGILYTEATSIMLPKFTDGNQGMQTWKKDGDPFVFGKPPASYERYYVLGYPVNPSIDNPFMNVSWSYSGKGNYDAATNGKPKFEHSSDQGTFSWEAKERKECGGCGLEDYTRGPLRCEWERIWHQTVERKRDMDCEFKC